MRDIVLEPGCFLGLLTSSIEAYNRETNGFLLGKRAARRIGRTRRPTTVLKAAYPLQTEWRAPSFVAHGNQRAFDRARDTVQNTYVGLDLVGGFHSHTGPDGAAGLSSLDVRYILDELYGLRRQNGGKSEWLEVVVAIRRKEYARPHAPRWTWRKYRRKIGCTLTIGQHTGYDATMGAYWVRTRPRPGNGGLDLDGVEEVRLHIPWERRL